MSSAPAPTPIRETPPPLGAKRLAPLKVKHQRRATGVLARMRIRKKLIFLHTCFSLGLAGILLVLVRPAITEVVERAELDEAKLSLSTLVANLRASGGSIDGADHTQGQAHIRAGTAATTGLSPEQAARAAALPGIPIDAPGDEQPARAVVYMPGATPETGRYYTAEVQIADARAAVVRLYVITTIALLAVYALVAAALEIFVLPQHVYGPIRRMLDADQAVQDGRADEELIQESLIPADELGEIMRSRNEAVVSLRRNQKALAEALDRLEVVATDLKRKNHLLEAARRNLADADRLASLGMMSAGLAHELNTPLAVLKGLVETLNKNPRAGLDPASAGLMLRVVGRLERLGESLLDFARVRPPHTQPTDLSAVVDEAAMLVRLDREATDVQLVNEVTLGTTIECDTDRIVQVLVNLLRNAVDAIRGRPAEPHDGQGNGAVGGRVQRPGTVVVQCERSSKDGRDWVSLTVSDDGPGIDPEVLPRLFEPFASTRLDARGTGLGLAVSDGIVREHGGVILARNRPNRAGSIFEIVLPVSLPPSPVTPRSGEPQGRAAKAGLETGLP
jgi:signal transduction histidine kinase